MNTRADATTSVYSAAEYAAAYPDGMERHYWTQARFRVVLRTLRRHGALTGRVLDFGAGRGTMVGMLRGQSIDAWGIEPGPAPVSAELAKYVATSFLWSAMVDSERRLFSDVLLLDVLEHLEEPEKLLLELRRAFPEAQRFLVTVPARKELWSNYDERFGHYRRYDLASLRRLLECLPACRVTTCHYFFRALYPPIWLLAHLPEGRSTVMHPPRVPLVHRTLAELLTLTDRVLPPRWYGSSLIAVLSLQ